MEHSLKARAGQAGPAVKASKSWRLTGGAKVYWKGKKKEYQRQESVDQLEGVSGIQYEMKPSREALDGLPEIVKPMRRRKFATSKTDSIGISPGSGRIQLETTALQVVLRCFVWFYALALFGMGIFVDKLRKRDSPENRARRLFATFQEIGGTIIKIGQQLAMRVDLLPYVYCKELAKLMDSVKPFPVRLAIEAVERSLGKPIGEVFASFDPVPIGSASIACVYQGTLRTGEKVAVKVRRPGVDKLFAADLRAMGWMLSVMESLTMFRPGLMRNFLLEFGGSLTEELDFKKESRYQELFRKYAKKKSLGGQKNHFTAPRLFTEHSSIEVLVQEFTAGIWAWEIVAAVEQDDQAALARMRELNIDPKVVAKRLVWASFWGTISNILFHADPHPANIVVRANNELVFVDFGACGILNKTKRNLQAELFYHQSKKDIHGMVRCAMALMAPLPHIEVHELEKELEFALNEAMINNWSKYAPWQDRTSAALWLRVFEVTRKYQMPVNLDTVRFFRANMLYDTLAYRLDKDLDPFDVYDKYAKDLAALARKRVKRKISKRWKHGLMDKDYQAIEELLTSGSQAMFKMKRFLSRQLPDFSYMVEKSVFTFVSVIKIVLLNVALVTATCSVVVLYRFTKGFYISTGQIFWQVITNGWFQATVVLLVLLEVRRILFRLNDREIGREV